MAVDGKSKNGPVVLDPTTSFKGLMRFKETVCIQGKFNGTIEASGELIVDKGADVRVDHIAVDSLTARGAVMGEIRAVDRIDLCTGAEIRGNITTARLRIAEGVLFDGQCIMTGVNNGVEIFSRPTEEIKAELQRSPNG